MKIPSARRSRIVIVSAAIVAFALCLSQILTRDGNVVSGALPAAAETGVNPVGSQADPARVLGVSKAMCKKCHESEVAAWMKTKHYKADDHLSAPKAKEYAAAMGVAQAELRKSSLCMNCHGTKTVDEKGDIHSLEYGVSCSSCHGASGGVKKGWLNPHGSFHETMTIPAAQETPAHRKARIAKIDKAGMIRPVRLYELARNCLSCHIVSNQKLVNKAKHGAMHKNGFELVEWSSGEVRHNFQQDKKTNRTVPSLWAKRTGGKEQNRKRLKFLVGLCVDLEFSVRNLSHVKDGDGKSDFAKFFAKRVAGRKEILEALMEALGDKAPSELEAVYEAVDSIKISKFNFKDSANAKKAVGTIAKNARAFAEKYDGSKIGAIDSVMSDILGKPRGKVFQPAQ